MTSSIHHHILHPNSAQFAIMLPRVFARASAIRPIARQAVLVPRTFTTSSVALKHKESADRE